MLLSIAMFARSGVEVGNFGITIGVGVADDMEAMLSRLETLEVGVLAGEVGDNNVTVGAGAHPAMRKIIVIREILIFVMANSGREAAPLQWIIDGQRLILHEQSIAFKLQCDLDQKGTW